MRKSNKQKPSSFTFYFNNWGNKCWKIIAWKIIKCYIIATGTGNTMASKHVPR